MKLKSGLFIPESKNTDISRALVKNLYRKAYPTLAKRASQATMEREKKLKKQIEHILQWVLEQVKSGRSLGTLRDLFHLIRENPDFMDVRMDRRVLNFIAREITREHLRSNAPPSMFNLLPYHLQDHINDFLY